MATEFDGLGHVEVPFVGKEKLCLLYGQPALLRTDQIECMVNRGHPVAEVLPQYRKEISETLKNREFERIRENRHFSRKGVIF